MGDCPPVKQLGARELPSANALCRKVGVMRAMTATAMVNTSIAVVAMSPV